MDELKSHYFENFKKLPALQKASLLSIVFLVVMLPLGVLLALGPVNLFPKAGGPTVTPPSPITPPNPNATAELVLTPINMVQQTNSEFDLRVLVNGQDHSISAVDVAIDFDPAYLEAESVTTATESGSLSVVLEEPQIDNNNGRITLAQGAQPRRPVGGVEIGVATIHFKTKSQTGYTNIRANTDSRAAAVGVNGNVLGSFDTVNLEIQPAASPVPSPSARKIDVWLFPLQTDRQIFPGTVLYNEEFIVEVVINSRSYSITAADISLRFNANIIEAQSVTGSSLPVTLSAPQIDNSEGSIRFVYGATPDSPLSSQEAKVAVVKFKAKSNTGSSMIEVVEPTQIAVVGRQENMVGSLGSAGVEVARLRGTFLAISLKFDGVENPDQTRQVAVTAANESFRQSTPVHFYGTDKGFYVGDFVGPFTDTNGQSLLNRGRWTIYAKGPAHLRRRIATLESVIRGANGVDATNLPLIPGDIVSDNTIGIDDYNVLVRHFGSRMPAEGSLADLNFDGRVDIFDYNLIVRHFGKTGDNIE